MEEEKGHGEALPASPWPISAGTMAPIVPPSQSMVLGISAHIWRKLQWFSDLSDTFLSFAQELLAMANGFVGRNE